MPTDRTTRTSPRLIGTTRATRRVARDAAIATLAVVAALQIGCPRSDQGAAPPLRPLLYTEPATNDPISLNGYEEWLDPNVDPVALYPVQRATELDQDRAFVVEAIEGVTPDALMRGVYHALMTQDADLLDQLVFTPEELAAAARMRLETARQEVATIRSETLATLEWFTPATPSRARPEGLTRLLSAGDLVVGRGRNIDGALTRDSEVPVMHWGSELAVQLVGSNALFTLRFPKLLADDSGRWRLAAAPVVDARFRLYRSLGMDLKPELMEREHALFPLSVGNYWHYRTRRPAVGQDQQEGYGLLTNNGYRDEVVAITEYTGYRLVRVRRLFDNPSRTSEYFHYLQTPLRLYTCGQWDCVRNIENVDWLLNHAQAQVPILVFPYEAGSAWGAGGLDGRNNVYRIQPEVVDISTPAGRFATALEVVRTTARGRESTFVVSGLGVVMRRRATGLESEIEELISYRVMQ